MERLIHELELLLENAINKQENKCGSIEVDSYTEGIAAGIRMSLKWARKHQESTKQMERRIS